MRTPVRAAATLTLALIALAGAGCGSSAPSASGTTATTEATTKLTAREKAVRFSECVRAHGVADFPDPNAKNDFDYGISVSAAVWTKAVNACRAWQPPGTLSAKRTPKQQSASLRLAACVRAHGVKDFPDPVNGEPVVNTYKIPSSNAPGGMTILNAALKTCRGLLNKVLEERG